tara:strand:+ start:77111 stop:77245 length:135 start_codon:yes stop_codon:yes gene_type:complete
MIRQGIMPVTGVPKLHRPDTVKIPTLAPTLISAGDSALAEQMLR